MAYQPLLEAGIFVAKHAIEQQSKPAQSSWRGRVVYYRVKNTLIIVGSITSAGILYSAYNLTSSFCLPNWAIGGVSLGISIGACVLGCCLWKNLPPKSFETAIVELEASKAELEKQQQALSEEREQFKQTSQQVLANIENTKRDNAKTQGVLVDIKQDVKNAATQLQKVSEQATAQQSLLQENTDRLVQGIGLLQQNATTPPSGPSGDVQEYLNFLNEDE